MSDSVTNLARAILPDLDPDTARFVAERLERIDRGMVELGDLHQRRGELKAEADRVSADVEAAYEELRPLLPTRPGPRIGFSS